MVATAALAILFGLSTHQEPTPPAVDHEINRLQACHPVFKLAEPPINARFVWTQPFDLTWAREGPGQISIEFSIQNAQSDFFKTREEAEHAQSFNPLFDLRQRSHYAIDNGTLRLLWRESFLNSKWKRQKTNAPEFACWQTFPSGSSQ